MDGHTQGSPVDTDDLKARLDGDDALILTVLTVFNRSCRLQLDMLETALARGDVNLASRSAHTIVGAAGNASVKYVRDAAGRLEAALAGTDRGVADGLFAEVQTEFDRFSAWMAAQREFTQQEA